MLGARRTLTSFRPYPLVTRGCQGRLPGKNKSDSRRAGRTAMIISGIFISGLLLTSVPPAWTEDFFSSGIVTEKKLKAQFTPVKTPTRAVWDRSLKKRQYGLSPKRKLPVPNSSSGNEGEELVTEPILQPEEETPAQIAPTATPLEIPAAQRVIRNFSYNPEAIGLKPQVFPGRPRASPLPEEETASPAPWQDEGVDLKTEPLFKNPQASNSELRSLRAELDRTHVHLDESFTLSLEIVVPELRGLTPFHLPELTEFNVINTYQSDLITTTEGKVWRVRIKRYVFLARKPGTFTIPALEVIYQGQRHFTQPLTVEVEGARSGYAYRQGFGKNFRKTSLAPAAPDIAGSPAEEVEFTAQASKTKIYVHQQLTLTVHLHFKSDKETTIKYTPPPLAGFLIEELPQTNTEEMISGAEQHYLARNYQTALFPVVSGNLMIGSAQVHFISPDKDKSQTTESITIQVQSLPPDPEPLSRNLESRLVGHYRLSVQLETPQGETDVPLHLKIVLQGEGNIRDAPEPYVENAERLRLYLEDQQEKISLLPEAVAGVKTFIYLLVFDKPGTKDLGMAQIRYFNPTPARWESASAKIPRLRIKPRLVAAEPLRGQPLLTGKKLDLRPNHAGSAKLRRENERLLESPFFWGWQALGPLLLGLVVLIKMWRAQERANLPAYRVRRAYAVAKKSLREVNHYMHEGDIRGFYDTMTRTTTEYLAAKFGVPIAYIGVERLPDYFDQYQVPEKLRMPFKVALTACEYVRYAAVILPKKDMRALHQDLKTAIRAFEKWWEKERHQNRALTPTIPLLILLSLWAAHLYAGEAELDFWRGNAFAEKGDYRAAEAEYRKVIEEGIADPNVYYNLGNTYLKQNQPGLAILAYQRGLRLAPRDRDLKHNLNQALFLTPDHLAGEPRTPFGRLSTAIYQHFTAPELAVLASLIYYFLLGWLLYWFFQPARAWSWGKKMVGLLGLLLLLVTSWAALRYWEPRFWKRAVVMTPQMSVYLRPYPQAETIYTLHEGACVSIGREEEVWVEIYFTPDRRGWVERSSLALIE